MGEKRVRRGFVTIATGKDLYYELALNLLHSYRLFAASDVPFAILCDRQHSCTKEFDEVVIMEDASCTYMDKLQLCRYSPFDETIFIDADALILRDPNELWEDFKNGSDVSCYGTTIPLESREGWYYYKDMGRFQDQLHYGIQMHGGLYYFRNTELSHKVFSQAVEIAHHYADYRFAHFAKPADEPVLALSMGLLGCKPCPRKEKLLFFVSVDGKLRVSHSGELRLSGKSCNPIVLHFGTINTRRFAYRYLQNLLETRRTTGEDLPGKAVYRQIRRSCLPLDIKIPLVRRVKRFVKYALPPKLRAKIQNRRHK